MDTRKIRLSVTDSIALAVFYLLYNPVLQIAVARMLT